ncbi:transposase [Bacillus lacus]|uniref:Transposase n=1 Tax=Metabacillus lacus TaxID=1983721 RepID=A0A7X2J3N2_9BACI|nr:transposase [Metabacillus lacus]MRX74353.1 transposase [Metabacillus lacus]
MPRCKRVWIPEQFYHVVCRGNRRDPLYRNATDFEAFLHILQQLHEKHKFEITSYCLMTNHYHLQIRSSKTSLSNLFALINKRYANYYNSKYKLSGHVYEKRYFSKLIQGKEGMFEVSRYIHLNPVEAKIVKSPKHYPWSSFHLYKDPRLAVPVFMRTDILLKYYHGTNPEKRGKFCEETEEVRPLNEYGE